MAKSKREQFEQDLVQLSEFGRAIAHPARVAILKRLAGTNTCICGEIVHDLPLAQSTVSQHLKSLRSLGLIRGEVEGPRSCYCIDWARFNELATALRDFLDSLPSPGNDNVECSCDDDTTRCR